MQGRHAWRSADARSKCSTGACPSQLHSMKAKSSLTSLCVHKHRQAADSSAVSVQRKPPLPGSLTNSRAHVKGEQRRPRPASVPTAGGLCTTMPAGSCISSLALQEPFDPLASTASDGLFGVTAAHALNRSESAKAPEPHLPFRLTLNSTDERYPKLSGSELYSSLLSSLQRSLRCDRASEDSHPSSFADVFPPPRSPASTSPCPSAAAATASAGAVQLAVKTSLPRAPPSPPMARRRRHRLTAMHGTSLRRLQRSIEAGSYGRTDVLPVHAFLPSIQVKAPCHPGLAVSGLFSTSCIHAHVLAIVGVGDLDLMECPTLQQVDPTCGCTKGRYGNSPA
jgi:hypothetical protein